MAPEEEGMNALLSYLLTYTIAALLVYLAFNYLAPLLGLDPDFTFFAAPYIP